MMLVLVFLVVAVICFGVLIYSRTEKYKFLSELKVDKLPKIERRIIDELDRNVRKRLTGGAKYGYGSDYDKIKQKRPRGSIRDTGEDH